MKGVFTMKKSSFVALILGTVSGVLFSLGMCMALLPEWNAFREGIVFGALGLVLGLVTLLIWRKMEHKAPVKFSFRQVAVVLMGIVGALILGLGMCFCMVWAKMVLGVLIGLAGIVILLSIIPVVKGLK